MIPAQLPIEAARTPQAPADSELTPDATSEFALLLEGLAVDAPEALPQPGVGPEVANELLEEAISQDGMSPPIEAQLPDAPVPSVPVPSVLIPEVEASVKEPAAALPQLLLEVSPPTEEAPVVLNGAVTPRLENEIPAEIPDESLPLRETLPRSEASSSLRNDLPSNDTQLRGEARMSGAADEGRGLPPTAVPIAPPVVPPRRMERGTMPLREGAASAASDLEAPEPLAAERSASLRSPALPEASLEAKVLDGSESAALRDAISLTRGNTGHSNAPQNDTPMALTNPVTTSAGPSLESLAYRAPVPHPAAAQAIAQRIEMLSSQGGGVARIRLHPPELGQVELSVRVHGSAVEVVIRAEEAATHFAATNARTRLSDNLALRDMHIESFDVSSFEEGSHGDADARPGGSETFEERDARRSGSSRGGGDAGKDSQSAAEQRAPQSIEMRVVDLRV